MPPTKPFKKPLRSTARREITSFRSFQTSPGTIVTWILKLVVLIAVLIALVWTKYAFVSSSFKTLYNQFYFLKNVSFYNAYWVSQSWLTTQKLTASLAPKSLPGTTVSVVEELLPKMYSKIDSYTFIFQFNNLMIIDEEFSQFYAKLLNEDNCLMIENMPVKCDSQFAKDIFANSYRSSIAFSYLAFNKFNFLFGSTNKTDLFNAYKNSMIDLNAITYTSYQLSNQKHRDHGYLH